MYGDAAFIDAGNIEEPNGIWKQQISNDSHSKGHGLKYDATQRMTIDKRFIIGSIFISVCQANNNPIVGGQELLTARAVITTL